MLQSPLAQVYFYIIKMQNTMKPITDLFAGADERNWTKVRSTMAPHVLLDYTSLAGGSPATLTPKQITDAWETVLPGFDRTHHQLFDFRVTENGDKAHASFSGKADHFIKADVWTVEATYDADLQKTDGNWLVTSLTLHLTRQSGNTNLPAQAAKNIHKTNP